MAPKRTTLRGWKKPEDGKSSACRLISSFVRIFGGIGFRSCYIGGERAVMSCYRDVILHCVLLRRRSSGPPPMSSVWIGGGPLSCEAGSAGGMHGSRRSGSLFDKLGCFLRMRHVGHMAGIYFDRLGLGALCHHALLVRIDRPVLGGHHVPGGLGLPGGRLNLVGERVGGDRHLRHSHEPRLLRRNVRCEVGREMVLFYPPVVVAVRFKCLGGLRQGLFDLLTALTVIERKCGNIDE